MSSPQQPEPTSPRRHRRRSSHRESYSRRARPVDVEATPYYDIPPLSYSPTKSDPRPPPMKSPTRKPKQEAYIQTLSSSRTPGGERDYMMTSPSANDGLTRKRTLVRPERSRINKDHPNFHYRQHAQNMTVYPSTTGNDPVVENLEESETAEPFETEMRTPPEFKHGAFEEDLESPPGKETLSSKSSREPRRHRRRKLARKETKVISEEEKQRQKELNAVKPPNIWNVYCAIITFWAPGPILACLGKPAKAQQRAWREKMGLISIILLIAAFVGFITFGFTQAVCGTPSVQMKVNEIGNDSMIFHGSVYNLNNMRHPGADGIPDGSNVLYDLPHKYGGQDGSFMFQNVNGACKGLITLAPGSDVPTDSDGNLAWYFPCNAYNQDGSSQPNETSPYYLGYSCHTTVFGRQAFYEYMKSSGDVYFTWDDIRNNSRHLTVYSGNVLDLDLLSWFNTSQVSYPAQFNDLRTNPAVWGVDLTHAFQSGPQKQMGRCLSQIIRVGSVDTESVGCIASKVVLYVSLVFILAIVLVKFLLALYFQWFLSRRFAASKSSMSSSPKKRAKEIEDWSEDIYRPPPKLTDSTSSAPSKRGSVFLPTTSRFTSPYATEHSQIKNRPAPTTMASQNSTARLLAPAPGSVYKHANGSEGTLPSFDPSTRHSLGASRSSLLMSSQDQRHSTAVSETEGPGPQGFIHEAVVPQPPPDWQPFGYPLAHAICLVTAYSEGEEGLRTTLDSVATTEYPNSHKTILVVCDGLIKGHGESLTTPEIALSMMGDWATLPDEVQAFSYVAVASGSKRHSMAKVYAGYYNYGENSMIPLEKQQRVPMMVIVKCGTPDEAKKSKPGNRGKRDSQIILMSFLQKVMFDERMTELEFEMFNGLWKITGISPDFYEVVLMVDADTKVFPDSLTHMLSAMVKDPEIMGLCGETKIANKRASWVTTIQVFE